MGFSAKWCLGLLPAVIASFAFMTSFLANFWCQTIQFAPTTNSSNVDQPVFMLGPWFQQETVLQSSTVGGETKYFVRDVCVDFPSGTYIDPKLKTVRAFSIIVILVGGLITVGLWLAPCFPGRAQSSWKGLGLVVAIFLTLFQGLTFLILDSSLCTDNPIFNSNPNSAGLIYTEDCQWSGGSTTNVVSTVLWFVTGIVMFGLGAPQPLPREPTETQEVTYQKTTNPEDGTTTVAQVAVVKGTAVPHNNNNVNNEKMDDVLPETA